MKKKDLELWINNLFALIFILLYGNWEPFITAVFVILAIKKTKYNQKNVSNVKNNTRDLKCYNLRRHQWDA